MTLPRSISITNNETSTTPADLQGDGEPAGNYHREGGTGARITVRLVDFAVFSHPLFSTASERSGLAQKYVRRTESAEAQSSSRSEEGEYTDVFD
jgi:hypothetical protein